VAHALRVLLHTQTLGDFRDEYRALVACQHADGGWHPSRTLPRAPCGVGLLCLMLISEATAFLNRRWARRLRPRAIDYSSPPRSRRRWVDPRWADLDTTATR